MASLAVFIGVLGAVVLVSSGDLIVGQLSEDLDKNELAMQQIYVSVPSDVDLDNAAYIERLEQYPGVRAVEGRVASPVVFQIPGSDLDRGYVMASWEPFDEMKIQPMRLIEGRYPDEGLHQIAVERRMADRFGLETGDEVTLDVLGGGDLRKENWTITGIVFQPYPSWDGNGQMIDEDEMMFATYEDARYIGGFTGLGVFYLRYSDYDTAKDQNDKLFAAVSQETPYIPVFNYIDDPSHSLIIRIVKEVTDALSLLGLIAVIVSGFLIVNVINSIIVEQKRQIGVMKSLGATRWDNFRMYVGIALTYGVIGMIPGVVLGLWLGSLMAQALDETAFTYIDGFGISTMGLIIGIVMGLAVPLLAALVPVYFGTRVTILEAMTDIGITADYGRGFIDRVTSKLHFPIVLRQGITNLNRKKSRMALTSLTLVLAVTAFMSIFSIFSSMRDEIGNIYDDIGYDITVTPNEYHDFGQVKGILDNVEGVQRTYPGVGTQVSVEGYVDPFFKTSQLQAFGFDPSTDTLNLNYKSGTGWRDDPTRQGVVLRSDVADQLDKKVGDTLVMTAGGRAAEYEIIGTISFPYDIVLMEWQSLAEFSGFTLDGVPAPNTVLVRTSSADPSVDDADRVITNINNALMAQGITATFNNVVEDEEESVQGTLTFGMLFSVAALVMAIVGAIGLLSTLSMGVFERQKEIGVMRAIGAGSTTVASQFLVEGLLVGFSAWAIGAPLSYFLAKAIVAMLPFGLEVSYQPFTLVIGLVGIMAIATIASLWPSIRAARKTVSEIIRYQ